MSDHSNLQRFFDSIEKTLDIATGMIYTARCKIRVERKLVEHAKKSKKESSASAKSKAYPSSRVRQGGPETPPSNEQGSEGPSETDEEFLVRTFCARDDEDGRS